MSPVKILFTVICIFWCLSGSRAQSIDGTLVSVNFTKTSLSESIGLLKNTTSIEFSYDLRLLESVKERYSKDFQDQKVSVVLNFLLQDTEIEYKVIGSTIVLTKSQKPKQETKVNVRDSIVIRELVRLTYDTVKLTSYDTVIIEKEETYTVYDTLPVYDTISVRRVIDYIDFNSKGWFINFNTGIALYREVFSMEPVSGLDKFSETLKAPGNLQSTWGIGGGLRAGGLIFSTGINFRRQSVNYNISTITTDSLTLQGDLIEVIVEVDEITLDTTRTIYFNSNTLYTVNREAKNWVNTYEWIDVPLMTGLSTIGNKWRGEIHGGVMLSFPLRSRFSVVENNNEFDIRLKNTMVSFILQGGPSCNLDNKTTLQVFVAAINTIGNPVSNREISHGQFSLGGVLTLRRML